MQIPYSYRYYQYHIRIRYDQWESAVDYMWNIEPKNPCELWRTIAGTMIAVNDPKLATIITLKFG